MDRLQVSMLCLLLKMTFDPGAAQLLQMLRCPTCDEGYFVRMNCSEVTVDHEVRFEGVQCSLCTDCSATDQVTLVNCSTFADSLCGNVTPTATPTDYPVSAPEVWILLTVILLSLLLVLLLSLLLTLLSCRHRHNKPRALDPL
ncbi:uncharacterized protein AB9X84_015715 [Acanthopagrus schlegelii]